MDKPDHPGVKLLNLGHGLQYVATTLRHGFFLTEPTEVIDQYQGLQSDLRELDEIAESLTPSDLIFNIRVMIEMTDAALTTPFELSLQEGNPEQAARIIKTALDEADGDYGQAIMRLAAEAVILARDEFQKAGQPTPPPEERFGYEKVERIKLVINKIGAGKSPKNVLAELNRRGHGMRKCDFYSILRHLENKGEYHGRKK